MPDFYSQMFGEEVARGLGLERLSQPVFESTEDYDADPAEAFSRMAERLQGSSTAVPIPFANILTNNQALPSSPFNHPKE